MLPEWVPSSPNAVAIHIVITNRDVTFSSVHLAWLGLLGHAPLSKGYTEVPTRLLKKPAAYLPTPFFSSREKNAYTNTETQMYTHAHADTCMHTIIHTESSCLRHLDGEQWLCPAFSWEKLVFCHQKVAPARKASSPRVD